MFGTTYAASDSEPILPTLASYSTEGYQANGVVFACIGARLGLFAEATFKWRDLTSKRLFGSPELRLLEEPWPGGTTGELLARMEQDVSLAGNAFIALSGDGRSLMRLRPDNVDILSHLEGSSRQVVGYVYWSDGRGVGEPELFPVESVAHWSPIPDPLANWRGMSWLTPVAREINADQQMTAHKSAFLKNGATPNSLITYQQKLSRESLPIIQAQWQARYGGPDGWKTAILDQGADFQVIGNTFEQMDFATVQGAGELRIAQAAGVPAIVAGLREGLDRNTMDNYGPALRRFADLTIRPNWRSACAALSKLLSVPTGARLWYDTTDIAALREGEQERAATMSTLSSAASTLLMAGYTAESITSALTANDLTLLQHTGLLSVQLQKPGTGAPA